MKVTYLATAFSIVRYMRFDKVVRQTYDKEQVWRGHHVQAAGSAWLALPMRERVPSCGGSQLAACWSVAATGRGLVTRGRAVVSEPGPGSRCCHSCSRGLPSPACLLRPLACGEQDTFRYIFLIAPCALLALVLNHRFSPTEVLWTFSIYLEAVAILPQLVLMQRTQNIDNLTANYVALLG